MYAPHSFWEPTRTYGLQTGTNGRPHKDCGDFEFGSIAKCETTMSYPRTYEVLQEFIKSYAQITALMEKLLKKNVKLC